MPPTNIDQRYLASRDRCLRGSLPLKKRRVSLDSCGDVCTFSTGLKDDTSIRDDLPIQNNSVYGLNEFSCSSDMRENNNSRSMTALTLVASAAVSAYKSSHQFDSDLRAENQDSTMVDESLTTGQNCSLNSFYKNGTFWMYNTDCNNVEKKSCTSIDDYEELRRRPCLYEEERFEDSIASANSVCGKDCKQSSNTSSSVAQTHQDRRFTGVEGEIRCLATTTRGRACAYTCVGGTKYCYLHADYDTNPPPRRWSHKGKTDLGNNGTNRTGSSSRSTTTKNTSSTFVVGNSDEGKNFGKELEKLPESQTIPNSSPPSITSDEMSRLPSPFPTMSTNPVKRSRRNSSSKLAAKHADSPFPLLSMISTDQWYQKYVKIASGPLTGKVGRVEKWGNGWVSVDVPEMGLHNRRSFELYICSASGEDTATLDDTHVPEDKGYGDDQDSSLSLYRCVSRDVVSPLIFTSTSKHSSSKQDASTTSFSSIPHNFQSCPPDDVKKPCAVLAACGSNDFSRAGNDNGYRIEMSPLLRKAVSGLGQAPPEVTPLPSAKEMHCYDENTITVDLQIPESICDRNRTHARG